MVGGASRCYDPSGTRGAADRRAGGPMRPTVEPISVGPLQIEILGRAMIGEALVVAAGATPLIGQIPLENLDLILDPKSREVSVNPASPDAPLLDILSVTRAA